MPSRVYDSVCFYVSVSVRQYVCVSVHVVLVFMFMLGLMRVFMYVFM